MNSNPEISVLMPVFNGEKYLAEAVDSILSQTFTDFEFIIINDGSTDATSDILAGYSDKRIKLVSLEQEGLIYCLNKGLELSAGKYVARMDSGDVSCPGRLQAQYSFMESHPEIGICGANFKEFLNNKIRYTSKLPANDTDIRAQMFAHPAFCPPTVMMRKDVLKESGLKYDEDFFGAEDYLLWTKLLDYTQGAIIPQVLLYHRIQATNATVEDDNDIANKIELMSKIQHLHMQKHGVSISQDECYIFTLFTDTAAAPFDFTGEEGKLLEYLLVKISSQLPTKGNLDEKVSQYICKTLAYRAIRQKQIGYCLKSSFYRKLFVKGVQICIKEKILG